MMNTINNVCDFLKGPIFVSRLLFSQLVLHFYRISEEKLQSNLDNYEIPHSTMILIIYSYSKRSKKDYLL